MEEACRGFLDLAKGAAGGICGSIFGDGALVELFYRMYAGGEDWAGGRLVSTIVATLEDYLEEYQQYIMPSFFKRCALTNGYVILIFHEILYFVNQNSELEIRHLRIAVEGGTDGS